MRANRWFAAVCAALALSACGGGSKGTPSGNSAGDGLGDSTKPPAGVAYQLPDGIKLDGGITGADARCWELTPVGDGSYFVPLCVSLANTSSTTITVTLPPGLIFISGSTDFQNGIILQPVTIEVPGGEVVIVQLATHCLNLGRHVPDDGAPYALGPVTTHPGLLELIRLVAGKTLTAETSSLFQAAVWEITDQGGLTEEMRTQLKAL